MRVSGLTELCGCAANSSGSLLACHDVSAVMSLVMKSHVLFSNEIGGYSPLSKKNTKSWLCLIFSISCSLLWFINHVSIMLKAMYSTEQEYY